MSGKLLVWLGMTTVLKRQLQVVVVVGVVASWCNKERISLEQRDGVPCSGFLRVED